MTHLEQVKHLNRMFDVPIKEGVTAPFNTRWEHRLNLMQEELNEFKDACEANDTVEVLDALVDLQVMLLGTVLEMGYQDVFDKAFDMVQRANLCKVCLTKQEAIDTVASYAEKGIDTYYKPVLLHYVVYRTQDNKFLKNKNWVAPDYTKVL